MGLIRASNYTFCYRMRARNYEVVITQIKLLDRQWHQRKIFSVRCFRPWHSLQEGSFWALPLQKPAVIFRNEIKQREHISIGIDFKDTLQHPLSSRING